MWQERLTTNPFLGKNLFNKRIHYKEKQELKNNNSYWVGEIKFRLIAFQFSFCIMNETRDP